MKISIEELSSKMEEEVIRIGGEVSYYAELDECIIAEFEHHEVETQGDTVIITDDLTGYSIIIKNRDFYTIELF